MLHRTLNYNIEKGEIFGTLIAILKFFGGALSESYV